MTVLVTLSVPATDFALGAALSERPDVSVRLESIVPVGEKTVPHVWVSGLDPEHIEEEMGVNGTVEGIEVLGTAGDEVLVRVTWTDDVGGFLAALTDARVTVLEGVGSDDGWEFTLRFVDHNALSAFDERCRENGVRVRPVRIRNPAYASSEQGKRFGLTETQRETLVRARELGYFDIPRETTLGSLAEDLGVSDTAVSQRLRRGTERLIDSTLVDRTPGSSEQ